MREYELSFGDIFRGIADRDFRLLFGFLLECLIMALPFLIIAGVFWFR